MLRLVERERDVHPRHHVRGSVDAGRVEHSHDLPLHGGADQRAQNLHGHS